MDLITVEKAVDDFMNEKQMSPNDYKNQRAAFICGYGRALTDMMKIFEHNQAVDIANKMDELLDSCIEETI